MEDVIETNGQGNMNSTNDCYYSLLDQLQTQETGLISKAIPDIGHLDLT